MTLNISTIIGIAWWFCQKYRYVVVLTYTSGKQEEFASTNRTLASNIAVAISEAVGKVHAVGFGRFVGLGKYRGVGDIEVTKNGLEIRGRHVHSSATHWIVLLILAVATLILYYVTGILFVIGAIPIILFLNFIWLKREDISLPFSAIKAISCNPDRQLVAVEFSGNLDAVDSAPYKNYKFCSPAVLKTPNHEFLFRSLQRMTSAEVVPFPKTS